MAWFPATCGVLLVLIAAGTVGVEIVRSRAAQWRKMRRYRLTVAEWDGEVREAPWYVRLDEWVNR